MSRWPPPKGIDPLSVDRGGRLARRRRVDRPVCHDRGRARRSARAPSSIPTSSSAPARASARTACCTRTCRSAKAWSIGHRVIVQNGAVIGSDGFGFVKQPDGSHLKIPQPADVVIEDDVEIGANTTIDRPAIGETRIRAGTKIDNLVQIAHGVSVGRHVAAGGAGRHRRQHHHRRRRGAGRTGRRVGPPAHRQGRRGDGADRDPELGRRRRVRFGLSGDRQSRLAEILGRSSGSCRRSRNASRSWKRASQNSRRSSSNVGHARILDSARGDRRVPGAACWRPARRAQSPAPDTAGPDFLSRAEFHLSANVLAAPNDDQRFSWDAHFGGDVDVFDYVVGRVVGAGRLPRGARRRVPSVRSEPGVLRARSVVLVPRPARPRLPASSTMCRGTSAIGRSSSRSPGTSAGARVLRRVDRQGPHDRSARRRRRRSLSIPTSTTAGRPTPTC